MQARIQCDLNEADGVGSSVEAKPAARFKKEFGTKLMLEAIAERVSGRDIERSKKQLEQA